MNATMVDAVSQPRRLAEIRRRWMHDNNELHQARITIQELIDERYRFERQLYAAGLRESRFASEKSRAEDDLKRVIANLTEERVIWARDAAEKDHILSRAKAVQEELERKAVSEAQKERYQNLTLELVAFNAKVQAKQVELEEREEKLRELQQLCDSLERLREAKSALDQTNAEVDGLTSRLAALQGDRNWLITQGLVGAFEYLRQSESFVTLLDRMSSAAYTYGNHDGIHEGYVSCQQTSRITPEFQEMGGKLTTEMADALEAVYNDSPPAYVELVDKVVEDGVDSLCQMLDMAEESGEE
ncbi:hypothetical protein Hdeb2414_s0014g00433721 [Helianthus debilis subsp. tardiflorus]